MKCKLCQRQPTLNLNHDFVSCRNPDCPMDEVEMTKEEWEALNSDLQKENDELRAKIADIQNKWELASSDISSLFETQPMNQNDGSFAIDGQSCHELFTAIKSTPAQSLAEVKSEAVARFAEFVKYNYEGPMNADSLEDFADKYANKLKEGE